MVTGVVGVAGTTGTVIVAIVGRRHAESIARQTARSSRVTASVERQLDELTLTVKDMLTVSHGASRREPFKKLVSPEGDAMLAAIGARVDIYCGEEQMDYFNAWQQDCLDLYQYYSEGQDDTDEKTRLLKQLKLSHRRLSNDIARRVDFLLSPDSDVRD